MLCYFNNFLVWLRNKSSWSAQASPSYSSDYEPKFAIDGKISKQAYISKGQPKPYLEVDLGQEHEILAVKLTHRMDITTHIHR